MPYEKICLAKHAAAIDDDACVITKDSEHQRGACTAAATARWAGAGIAAGAGKHFNAASP
jgi:hypothetical protein